MITTAIITLACLAVAIPLAFYQGYEAARKDAQLDVNDVVQNIVVTPHGKRFKEEVLKDDPARDRGWDWRL